MLIRPSGTQLAEIAALIDEGVIRPVIDKFIRLMVFERRSPIPKLGERRERSLFVLAKGGIERVRGDLPALCIHALIDAAFSIHRRALAYGFAKKNH